MRIDIITCLPQMLDSFLGHSIVQRSIDKGLVQLEIHDLREFAIGKHKQTDDYAFGGGAGMVMMPEPLYDCITHLQSFRTYDHIIYLAPDGVTFKQRLANTLSMAENLMLICGHYKGIDERIRERMITMEISIGDYVLSGGELAAAVVSDALIRLIPGVLNDETSALTDTFQDNLLAPPVYTRPADFKGWKVPEVLLSGNEKAIEEWRTEQSLLRTQQRRPDLLKDYDS